MYDDVIELLNSDDYYKAKESVLKLSNNDNFINQMITIENPFVFDRFTKMLEYKIDTSKLYEERNAFIEKIILYLNNKVNIPDRWVTEYIISYFFQDNYYNFMSNLFQMVHYLQHTGKKLVSLDNIHLYNEFRSLTTMSIKEKVELFKKFYQRKNLMELFYDDMNKVKEDSYQELVNASLKLTHDKSIYYKDLSRTYGVDVYYLNGEDFFGFVKCFDINRNDLSNHEEYLYSKDNRLGYSFSYIGNHNIGTIDYDLKGVVLYYDDIDYQDIMYVHHGDLHAKKMEVQDDYLSEKENEILTPDSLIYKTNNYNEIYIKGKEDGFKPKALVCYDTITHDDIAFARKYQLSLLLINTKKYEHTISFDENYEENTYVI